MTASVKVAEPVAVDETFAALSDPTRRRVVELLRKQPMRAGELAERAGMSNPAMSRHLRVLRTQGFIEELREPSDARVRLYRLRPERFDDLERWIADIRAFWTEQLASFKAHVEKGPRSS